MVGTACLIGLCSKVEADAVERSSPGTGEGLGKDLKASEEYRLGVMIKAVAAAMAAPDDPKSMQVIVDAGTDSRYYMMIRGWLKESLRATESQLEVARDADLKAKFAKKAAFIKRAIRRIDLE